MSNCDAASLSRKPRPRRAASISPVVAATSAYGSAVLMPPMIHAVQAGATTFWKISRRVEPISCDLRDQSRSTDDAPANVLKNSRKNTTIVTSTIFGSMSRPKNMMNSGASATSGTL